jgi:hypothetical protein
VFKIVCLVTLMYCVIVVCDKCKILKETEDLSYVCLNLYCKYLLRYN